jgi:hypothetical protein
MIFITKKHWIPFDKRVKLVMTKRIQKRRHISALRIRKISNQSNNLSVVIRTDRCIIYLQKANQLYSEFYPQSRIQTFLRPCLKIL